MGLFGGEAVPQTGMGLKGCGDRTWYCGGVFIASGVPALNDVKAKCGFGEYGDTMEGEKDREEKIGG